MKEVNEKGYTYLGILEFDKMKEHEMKIKVTAEYKRRLTLILKSKLNGKNKIQAINTWAVVVIRYGAGIINWKVDELKKMDRRMVWMVSEGFFVGYLFYVINSIFFRCICLKNKLCCFS